jgi:hypothetical protein
MSSLPFVASRSNIDRLSIPTFFVLVGAALITTSILRGPLSWDGAFYLFELLDHQFWFLPQYRLINLPLQAPTLLVSHFTSNLKILALIFSLSYASVPMFGLAISYLICRQRRSLFIWPALGICLAALPGVFCFSSEALMNASLFWPLLLATVIGVGVGEFVLVALLALTMLVTHPNATVFFGLGTVTALISAKMAPFNRIRYAGALTLGLLCLGRLLMPVTEYERRQLAFSTLRSSFRMAVQGWPLALLALTLLAVIFCLRQSQHHKPKSFASDFALLGAVISAGLVLVPWSINPHSWWKGLDYRSWIPLVSSVVMGASAIDGWRKVDQAYLWRERQAALIAIAAVFLIILSVQSLIWFHLTNQLLGAIRGGGCISRTSLTWTAQTPFDHWSTAPYSIVLQGRIPHSLVLDGAGCDEYAANATVHILWLARRRGDGWFDFDQVRTLSQSASDTADPKADAANLEDSPLK